MAIATTNSILFGILRHLADLVPALGLAGLILVGSSSGLLKAERVPASSRAHLGTVAYVQDGDVFIRDLPDGPVRRLTRDGGNRIPRWSPSGNWLAVICWDDSAGWRLRLIRRDGQGAPRTLPSALNVSETTFSFSPVTEEIAVVRRDGTLTVTPLAAGGKPRKIVVPATEANHVEEVTWSPDGRWLAYTMEHQTPESGPRDDYRVSVWQIAASGHGTPRLLYVSRGHDAVPRLRGWSADSRHLLFWALHTSPGGSINADGVPFYACSAGQAAHTGSRPHPLFATGRSSAEVLDTRDFVSFPTWGSRAAVSVGAGRFLVENKRIALLDLGTRSVRRATSPRLAATYPTWSPDSARIAYLAGTAANRLQSNPSLSSTPGKTGLYVMDANGSHQRRLDSGRATDTLAPRWLGNRHLLFGRQREDRNHDTTGLWLINTQNGKLQCVAPRIENNEHGYGSPFDVWTPRR